MPKAATSSRSATANLRHNPLSEDILSSGHLRTQSSKKSKRKSRPDEDGEDGDRFVDAKLSRKILQIGQELADEDAEEQRNATGKSKERSNPAFDFDTRFEDDEVQSEDEEQLGDDQWVEDEVEEIVCFSTSCTAGYNVFSFN